MAHTTMLGQTGALSSVYLILIGLHATAGVFAFAAGCLAVARRSVLTTNVYLVSMVALVAFLTSVVAIDWSSLGTFSRILFAGLTVGGGYLIWRAVQARRLLPALEIGQRSRLFDHVGFTLVSLFVGFVIIATLDSGAPGWLAAGVGGVCVCVGPLLLSRVKPRLAPRPL